MGLNGLGPSTSRLSGVCSNQLSYKPIRASKPKTIFSLVVEIIGFEPMTPCLQGRCSSQLSYTPVNACKKSYRPKFSPLPYINKMPLFYYKEAFELKIWKKKINLATFLYRLGIMFNYVVIKRFSLKGGDPAAPSDTATLLRLHPSHLYYLRQLPPCG